MSLGTVLDDNNCVSLGTVLSDNNLRMSTRTVPGDTLRLQWTVDSGKWTVKESLRDEKIGNFWFFNTPSVGRGHDRAANLTE